MGPSGDECTQIQQAGFELAPGEQLASAVGPGTELEGVTAIFLFTDEDDFNALAATSLAGDSDTPVYRLAPSRDAPGPYVPGEIIFAPALTHPDLTARHTGGARITTEPYGSEIPPAADLLFLISPKDALIPVITSPRPADPQPGDTLVLLSPAAHRSR